MTKISLLQERDERTEYIESLSFKRGYKILQYGILLIALYRGFILKQDNSDLLILYFITAISVLLYQYKNNILTKTWGNIVDVIVLFTGLLGTIAIYLTR